MLTASQASGNIYQWTTDGNGQIVQSTTLCPDGAGVWAGPYAGLYNLDLAQAYLIGTDLTGANLSYGTLTNANFANANLTGAILANSTLTSATFANANLIALPR